MCTKNALKKRHYFYLFMLPVYFFNVKLCKVLSFIHIIFLTSNFKQCYCKKKKKCHFSR